MCKRLWFICQLATLMAFPGTLFGQAADYSLERYDWETQAQNALVPLFYQFTASVSGVNLDWAVLQSPATEVNLAGNGLDLSFGANYPVVGTNLNGGLANLNAAFPIGEYTLTVRSVSTNALTGRTVIRTNEYDVAFTNDFPDPSPALANPQPPGSLAATQTFSWSAYAAPAGSYTALYVLEGSFDAAFIQAILNEGLAALTNFSWQAAYPNLSPAQTTETVNNLDPTLDHIVWLEFHVASPQTSLPLNDVASSSINLSFFPGVQTPVLSAGLLADGHTLQITITGHPGYFYSVRAASNLGAAWQIVGGVTLDASGAGAFTDDTQAHTTRFYEVAGPE